MPAPIRPQARAFRDLERALRRRRLLGLGPRLRLEFALLALLVGAFLFWQARVPLDGLVRAGGAGAAVGAVAVIALILAAASGALAGARLARLLRTGPAGPEWLALPIKPAALERHLAWEARRYEPWLWVPALAVLIAAIGLVAPGWLVLLTLGFLGLQPMAGRIGCALGQRAARGATEARPGVPEVVRMLATAAPRRPRPRTGAAVWWRAPAWLALAAKDLTFTRRHGPTRRAAALPIALWVLSVAVWWLPGESAMRHTLAFGLSLLAAAALAEWLIALVDSDPFAVLRVLPIGVASVWGARAALAAAGTLLVVAAQAVGSRELEPHARQLLLLWAGGATLAIGILGVNYGVTLHPQAGVAGRMLGLSLALAVAASVMLPLSGWIILLSAVAHSARRLPLWPRLEEV